MKLKKRGLKTKRVLRQADITQPHLLLQAPCECLVVSDLLLLVRQALQRAAHGVGPGRYCSPRHNAY